MRKKYRQIIKDLGDQRKRQKLMPLLDNYFTEQLTFVARSLETSGQRNAANIITENSPARATKMRKAMNKNKFSL